MLKHIGIGLVAAIIIAIAGFFVWRAMAQSAIEKARYINPDTGIVVAENVIIGGIEQAITIRGHDPSAPVLLALHGGPGSAQMALSHLFQTGWERDFIVVEWDQRGAGKTRIPNADYDALTVDLMYSDAEEMVQHLRARFGQDKIFLLGHSWGSLLGIRLAHEHPGWFHAYIGAGQAVDMIANEAVSYAYAYQAATEAGDDKALKQLQAIGAPPYPSDRVFASLMTEREVLMAMGGSITGNSLSPLIKAVLTSPDYSFGDVLHYSNALELSIDALLEEMLTMDVREMGMTFELPLFFMLGRHDNIVPSSLAETYITQITAPSIETIWFENSRHFPMISEPEKFTTILRQQVRPLAGD